METQDNMDEARALESVDIVSQQTHCELTNVINADGTSSGKGLDKANRYKMYFCNASYTLLSL